VDYAQKAVDTSGCDPSIRTAPTFAARASLLHVPRVEAAPACALSVCPPTVKPTRPCDGLADHGEPYRNPTRGKGRAKRWFALRSACWMLERINSTQSLTNGRRIHPRNLVRIKDPRRGCPNPTRAIAVRVRQPSTDAHRKGGASRPMAGRGPVGVVVGGVDDNPSELRQALVTSLCRTAIGLKCKDGVVLVRPPSSPFDSNLSRSVGPRRPSSLGRSSWHAALTNVVYTADLSPVESSRCRLPVSG
jgi:hypothetical protein